MVIHATGVMANLVRHYAVLVNAGTRLKNQLADQGRLHGTQWPLCHLMSDWVIGQPYSDFPR